MDGFTLQLMREAERIASRHRLPEFYLQFKAPMSLARRMYFNHPLVKFLRELIRPRLRENLGHGIYHSKRVSLDSATLIYLELMSNQEPSAVIERLMMLGQLAGLLHDICRGQEKHAEAGAREAMRVLRNFPLAPDELLCIHSAIQNHEAFTQPATCPRPWAQVVSDCLYDADKFRWGPDNFTHTLWFMVDHQGLTPQELIVRFPWGMQGIARIQETFRTATGRQYGPEIIEVGMQIGKEIYHYLIKHFLDGK